MQEFPRRTLLLKWWAGRGARMASGWNRAFHRHVMDRVRRSAGSRFAKDIFDFMIQVSGACAACFVWLCLPPLWPVGPGLCLLLRAPPTPAPR